MRFDGNPDVRFGPVCKRRGGWPSSLLAGIIVLVLLAAGPVPGQPGEEDGGEGAFHPGRILIQPKRGIELPAVAALHAQKRTRVWRAFPALDNLQVIQLPPEANVPDMVRRYQQSGLVEAAEPDYIIPLAVLPNDPRFLDGTQWALHNTGQSGGVPDADIDAPEGWDTLHLAPEVVVAVVDSGIRYTHEDLAENMWANPDDGSHGWNAVAGNNDPDDDNGHGTHVAGIIGAVGNNGKGMAGVAWRVQLMALKFSDSSGSGSISHAIECIDFARSNGAHIINASWGMNTRSSMLERAIRRAGDEGILFVAAAGNNGFNNDSKPFYPASYGLDNIVSVAATTRTDGLAGFSNFGANSVHLGAPGSSIYSTYRNSNASYTYLSGTSMAAPHVAGAFALMRARFPEETHQELIERLLAATDPISSLAGKTSSGGRLNLHHALGPSLIADFSADATSGDAPLTVEFTDLSFGEIGWWEWNFGDGSPVQTDQHAVHTFFGEGQFTVTLTVGAENGATSSKSRVITVVANYQMEEASYNWIEPGGMPQVPLGANGASQAIHLPFLFNLYGQNYSQFHVTSHGLIGFSSQGLGNRDNTDMPNPAAPNAIIAPYWDDLALAGGRLHTGILGSAPNRRLVVSWVGVRHRSPPLATLTFQVILHEATGEIWFQYQNVDTSRPRGAGATATVGIEGPTGSIARKYSFNTKSLNNQQAISFLPTSLGGMTVTAEDFSASGYAGGPFLPPSQTYTIENAGSAALDWTASKTRDWVTLSASGGTLGAGQSTTVTALINSEADWLPPGIYLETISFLNMTSGNGNTTRAVSLTVDGVAGVLEISPEGGFTATGSPGGPFSPGTSIYTLINTGDATLEWSAQASQPWITLDASGGSLAAGESIPLGITINSDANELPEGTYFDEIVITNLTNGEGSGTLPVILSVQAFAGSLDVTPEDLWQAAGFAGGPFSPNTRVYTLANAGGESLMWSAESGAPWLELSSASGELPAGKSTEVTVIIGAAAAELSNGVHWADVTFFPGNGAGETFHEVALFIYQTATLSAVEWNPGTGGFTVRLTGEPGLICVIEASGDLETWVPVHTTTIPSDGVVEFTDEEAADFGRRFYRAVLREG